LVSHVPTMRRNTASPGAAAHRGSPVTNMYTHSGAVPQRNSDNVTGCVRGSRPVALVDEVLKSRTKKKYGPTAVPRPVSCLLACLHACASPSNGYFLLRCSVAARFPASYSTLDPGPVPWNTPTSEQRDVWIAAGVVGGVGALLCVVAIARHLAWWYHPRLQTYFVRLLGVVPAYFVCGLGSLLFPFSHATFVLVRSGSVTSLATSVVHTTRQHCMTGVSTCRYLAYALQGYMDLVLAFFAPHFNYHLR
jgi:hypothetical protein